MKQAWEAVKKETVVNCFRYCRMKSNVAEATKDPFADLDEDEAQLEDLVDNFIQTMVWLLLSTLMLIMKLKHAIFEVSEKWRQELWEMLVSNRWGRECWCRKRWRASNHYAITAYTEAIKLGNDMLTFFQSQGEEELSDSIVHDHSESATC